MEKAKDLSLSEMITAALSLSRADQLRLVAAITDGLAQDEQAFEDAYFLMKLRSSPVITQEILDLLETGKG